MTNKEAAYILSDNCCDYSCEELRTAFGLAIKALEERPRGKWIYIGHHNGLKVVECTNCLKRQYGSKKYCGNCGADMRKEAENE